ncbi:MAG: thiamine pyrophosphate-dependent enzyme [Victivallaceae bacterium]
MSPCNSYFSLYPGLSRLEFVKKMLDDFGENNCISSLKRMILVREFETRGEAAYLNGLIGGFYHSYAGEEAIATSLIASCGKENFIFASYRCHGYALELDVSPSAIAAELLGKTTGCALGRGGSMHMCADTMPGGFGIVGGQIPLALGGAFSAKYLDRNCISIAVIGDGAVAQGVFHESLNYASLHSLPLMIIVENNFWGMGTSLKKAIAALPIWERYGKAYDILSYCLNGMDFFNCLSGFRVAHQQMFKTQRPALIECSCARFRGHSISDPNAYRSEQEMKETFQQDPIILLKDDLIKAGLLTSEEYDVFKKEAKNTVREAFSYAENSPDPLITELEENVYAP